MQKMQKMHALLFCVSLALVGCLAGGPHNIEIHRVDIQAQQAHLDALNRDPYNEKLEFPCTAKLFGVTYRGDLELRGGFSRGVVKKSYGVKFAKDNRPKVNLFNYVGDKEETLRKLNLLAAWVDASFMRNKLTYDLGRELGAVAPRVVWTELYINNQYFGLYLIVEHVGDEMFDKLDWNDKDANVYKAVDHTANFALKENPLQGYDKKNNEMGSSDDVGKMLNTLHQTPRNFAEFERKVQPIINIRDWLLYSMSMMYAFNVDGFTKNYFLYRDQTINAPFRVIYWDSDATWGNNWNGERLEPSNRIWAHDSFSTILSGIPEYTFTYLTNMKCLIERGAFRADRIVAKVNAWQQALAPYVAKEEQRWTPRIDGRSYSAKVQDIRDYVQRRSTSFLNEVNSQLQRVANVGRDKVLQPNGSPYFVCGVVPSAKAPNQGGTPPPPQPTTGGIATGTTGVITLVLVCNTAKRTIGCSTGVLRILTSTWGRTDATTCNTDGRVSNTACNLDVRSTISASCKGKKTCDLSADSGSYSPNPCPGTSKYLRVSFTCISGTAAAQADTTETLDQQTSEAVQADTTETLDQQTSEASGLNTPTVAVIVAFCLVAALFAIVAIVVTIRLRNNTTGNNIRP